MATAPPTPAEVTISNADDESRMKSQCILVEDAGELPEFSEVFSELSEPRCRLRANCKLLSTHGDKPCWRDRRPDPPRAKGLGVFRDVHGLGPTPVLRTPHLFGTVVLGNELLALQHLLACHHLSLQEILKIQGVLFSTILCGISLPVIRNGPSWSLHGLGVFRGILGLGVFRGVLSATLAGLRIVIVVFARVASGLFSLHGLFISTILCGIKPRRQALLARQTIEIRGVQVGMDVAVEIGLLTLPLALSC